MKKLLITALILFLLSFIPLNIHVPTDLNLSFEGMSLVHPLGCDNLGRDIFQLMIYGFLRSIRVIFIGSLIGFLGGTSLGLLAGYYGKPLESILKLVADLSLIVPSFIVALILSAFFGLSPLTAGIAIGVFDIGVYGMQTKTLTTQMVKSNFIISEQLIGVSNTRIIFKHILPNIIDPLKASFASKGSSIVVKYAALSFIGLGSDITKPDWGTLLYSYRIYIVDKPLLMLWPTLGILLITLLLHIIFDTKSLEKEGIYYVK